MAYRGDPGDALATPTAAGPLDATFGPNRATLRLRGRRLHVEDGTAMVETGKRRQVYPLGGVLVVARDVPREDLGVWVEQPGPAGRAAMRRIFGVEPVSLLDPEGLTALRRLDAVARRLRAALADLAGPVRRAIEIGRGSDKVLLADVGDRHALYARRLFRGHARLTMEIFADGRIVAPDPDRPLDVAVTSRFGITVRGDYLRFADRAGIDLGRVAIPWLAPEDRDELARRIGQLVDRA
ncbi:MAG TPA: hypothetical protein VLX92_23810 [Kofleriaceae bacterium]|nr:hypothetical protein [Kofleriaceae bacterium]